MPNSAVGVRALQNWKREHNTHEARGDGRGTQRLDTICRILPRHCLSPMPPLVDRLRANSPTNPSQGSTDRAPPKLVCRQDSGPAPSGDIQWPDGFERMANVCM